MTVLIVPIVGDGLTLETRPKPKYIPAVTMTYRSMDFDGMAIVWAPLTGAQETAIAQNADALVVPPLGNTVAVTATRNALEALNIPAQWVSAGMTYRQVLKVVCGMYLILQCMNRRGALLRLAGNLNRTMAQIPAATRQRLSDAADEFGLNRSQITGSTTVRQALRIVGEQVQGITLGDL